MKKSDLAIKLANGSTKVAYNINEAETVRAIIELKADAEELYEGVKAHILKTYGESHTFDYSDGMMSVFAVTYAYATSYTDTARAEALKTSIKAMQDELKSLEVKTKTSEISKCSVTLKARKK